MDVAWGLCTRAASAVASSAHQPQERGGNTAGRRNEGVGVQGGGQRYKPDQPFSWPAHKYLRGSYINSRPEEGIKAERLRPRLLPHVGCTAPLIFIKYNRHISDPSWGRRAALVPTPGGSRSASRSPSAESQPRWIKRRSKKKKKNPASTKANVCWIERTCVDHPNPPRALEIPHIEIVFTFSPPT